MSAQATAAPLPFGVCEVYTFVRQHSQQAESRTMSQLLDTSAKGVYAISATPFTDAGDIDWTSVDSLVEFYMRCGVQGLTVLGMMGEAQKLSGDEAAEFTLHFLRRVNSRVPVIVGVSTRVPAASWSRHSPV
jgi:hypothetical protein